MTELLSDKMAIRDLLDAYSDAVTQNEGVRWGSLWAPESEWTLPGMDKVVGREAIVELWLQAMSGYSLLIMTATPGIITINGEFGAGRIYTSEVAFPKGSPRQLVRGQYDDEYVKIGGRWHFRSRAFRVLHSE